MYYGFFSLISYRKFYTLSGAAVISQYQKYHNTLCLSLQDFALWDVQWSQEKLETMLMQSFGGTNMGIMVFLILANWLF